jgi:hypothetical protein
VGDLVFDCIGAQTLPHAAAPTVQLRLRLTETTGMRVGAVVLRCQVRIQPQQRRYNAVEGERLSDLFGTVDRWADTLKPLLFTTLTVMVPAFRGSIELDVDLPCSYDLEVAASRYFQSLDDGDIPLLLLFSGTVFAQTGTGLFIEPVPWHKECSFRLPVRVWRETMNRYFPDSGWLMLRRDTLDALGRYKSRHALASWNDTVLALLAETGHPVDVAAERV